MKEISFELDPKEFRPTFKLGNFDAIFATGAIIPMFYMDDDTLRQEFHGRVTIQDAVIWGIGGEVHGSVYRMDDFHLGELTFKTLDVYVPNDFSGKPRIVLGASVLYGLSYSIYPSSRLTISVEDESELVRELTLQLQDGELVPFLNGTPLTED